MKIEMNTLGYFDVVNIFGQLIERFKDIDEAYDYILSLDK